MIILHPPQTIFPSFVTDRLRHSYKQKFSNFKHSSSNHAMISNCSPNCFQQCIYEPIYNTLHNVYYIDTANYWAHWDMTTFIYVMTVRHTSLQFCGGRQRRNCASSPSFRQHANICSLNFIGRWHDLTQTCEMPTCWSVGSYASYANKMGPRW